MLGSIPSVRYSSICVILFQYGVTMPSLLIKSTDSILFLEQIQRAKLLNLVNF